MQSPFRARFQSAPNAQNRLGPNWSRADALSRNRKFGSGGSIHDDNRQEAAIVRLLAMGGAAIAEEPALVGVGVEAKILEASNPRARSAFGNISVEVEHRMICFVARSEVARRVVARAFEGGDELWANLVEIAGDAGSKRGDDVAALGAKPLHRRHGRFDDPSQRAFPAGMRRSDDACALIGEKDHAAVSAGHAERQAGGGRHKRIAPGARAFRPQLGYGDRVGRVNLERHGQTLRRRSELCCDPGAILGHRLRRVTRADATIQRRVNALRDPPETGEKTMRNAGNPKRFRSQELSRAHADLALADWNPGGGGSLRSATAIVLKRAPISP